MSQNIATNLTRPPLFPLAHTYIHIRSWRTHNDKQNKTSTNSNFGSAGPGSRRLSTNMTDVQDGPARALRWGENTVFTPKKRKRENDVFPPAHPSLPLTRQLDVASEGGKSRHSHASPSRQAESTPNVKTRRSRTNADESSEEAYEEDQAITQSPQWKSLHRAWQNLPDNIANHLHLNNIHEPDEIVDAGAATVTSYKEIEGASHTVVIPAEGNFAQGVSLMIGEMTPGSTEWRSTTNLYKKAKACIQAREPTPWYQGEGERRRCIPKLPRQRIRRRTQQV